MTENQKPEENNNLNITMNFDELDQVKRKYKKIKKYMRSPLFAIKVMDGNEHIVADLLKGLDT